MASLSTVDFLLTSRALVEWATALSLVFNWVNYAALVIPFVIVLDAFSGQQDKWSNALRPIPYQYRRRPDDGQMVPQ